MLLQPQIRLKSITMKQLLQCHRPQEVLAFCKACNNYGINHSCPKFNFSVQDWLSQYRYATLILTTISTEPLIARRASLNAADYNSPTYQKYQQTADDNIYTRLSMYAFDQIKDKLNKRLLALEGVADNIVSIPPGSCTYCEVCAKKQGKPCLHPSKLRYSLEALGFLVSELLDIFFDYQIDWSRRDFGGDFVTISALFSIKQLENSLIENNLSDINLEL